MAETIRETNVAFMVDVVVNEAEKNINKFNNSAQSMGKSVEKANKKAKDSTKETTKEIKGLNKSFENLPGPIGRVAKQINSYVAGLNASKVAADAAAAGTNRLSKAVKLLGLALKTSGVLIGLTAITAVINALSRNQAVVDFFSTGFAGIANAFQKIGDNLIAGRAPLDGVADVFKDTVRLEGLSNQLRDKKIAFLQKEAEFEIKIANLKKEAQRSDLSALETIDATRLLLQTQEELFNERIKLANEEVEIRQQLIDLTGNLRDEDEELAELKANAARLEAQGIERSIRANTRLTAAEKALRKEIEDNVKAASDLVRTFGDLEKTDLELLKRDFKDALETYKELVATGEKLQAEGIKLEGVELFEFDRPEDLEKFLDRLFEIATGERQLEVLNIFQEVDEARAETTIKNERKRQLAIIDIQLESINKQIKIEEELQALRGKNSEEDIARLEKLRIQRDALQGDKKRTFTEFLFGDGATLEEIVDNILQITNGIDAILNERQKFLDNAISGQEKLVDRLVSLAENGADESLKIEQERLNGLLNEREKFLKRQRELAAIEIALNQAVATSAAITSIAEQKNPLLIALQVAALITGIAAAGIAVKNAFSDLPAFYEGTDDTGRGGSIDKKGGFKAVLHPNERVVPEKYNKHLKGVKNYELPMMAQSYKMIPTMFDFMGGVDANLNKGFDGLEKQISKLGDQIGGLKIETRMDRKGFANYLMGSNSFKKLTR